MSDLLNAEPGIRDFRLAQIQLFQRAVNPARDLNPSSDTGTLQRFSSVSRVGPRKMWESRIRYPTVDQQQDFEMRQVPEMGHARFSGFHSAKFQAFEASQFPHMREHLIVATSHVSDVQGSSRGMLGVDGQALRL